MKLTEKQFKSVIERAFVHGVFNAPFFPPHPLGDEEPIFNEEDRRGRLNETIEDCRQNLSETDTE